MLAAWLLDACITSPAVALSAARFLWSGEVTFHPGFEDLLARRLGCRDCSRPETRAFAQFIAAGGADQPFRGIGCYYVVTEDEQLLPTGEQLRTQRDRGSGERYAGLFSCTETIAETYRGGS
jgi:hypothetical protein